MPHASDGTLRRLHDEPFAIPDATFDHVARCRRCSARRDRIAGQAGLAGRLLSGPHPVPDVDLAWADFQDRLDGLRGRAGAPVVASPPARPRRVVRVSARTGVIAGTVAVAMAGTAAAAGWTTVFAPTHVAPVPVSAGDVKAIAGLMSMGDAGSPGGFVAASGSRTLPFGSVSWSSSGPTRQVASLAQAEAAAGFTAPQPAHLPVGVGAADRFIVQPRVSATVTFDSAAGHLAGTTVTFTAGPGVSVAYGSDAGGTGVPTLGVVAMPRPTAVSDGASLAEIEAFLLAQPAVPAQLAEEIRLIGDVSKVLPVPTPEGVASRTVHVGPWAGVALTAGAGAVSGVVWEDGSGVVHVVAGLLDEKGALGVADQIR